MLKHSRENKFLNCLVCSRCMAEWAQSHDARDGGAVCGACGKPTASEHEEMTMLEVTEPRRIWIPWTPGGTAAHGLARDGRTVLGPWITFSSAETFERALRYVGMTDQRLDERHPGRARMLESLRLHGHGNFLLLTRRSKARNFDTPLQAFRIFSRGPAEMPQFRHKTRRGP
jgi:hypothetical protein